MSDLTPSESASNIKSNKRPRSVVWDHFTISDSDKTKAICSHCAIHTNSFSYNVGGTTNLMNHLNSQHKPIINACENNSKQLRIDEALKLCPVVSYSQELFDDHLIDWIVSNDQPFVEVESEKFKSMIKLLKPTVSIMSSDTVKRRILAKYEVKLSEMKFMMETLDSKVSFTMDCWTSPNNLAFLGVTGHFIDKDWKAHAYTLAFKPLDKSHCGSNLYEAFLGILEDCGLRQKTMGITLDNASNNDAFAACLDQDDTSFSNFRHIRCFAHVLNLGAQAALNVIKDDLNQLRVGIRKIRSSPQSFIKFKEFQQPTADGKYLKPIFDVVTRWNSTADMLERSLKLKNSLISFFTDWDSKKKINEPLLSLNPQTWANFERILSYLQPFRKCTLMVCEDKYPTLSLVVPLYNRLMDHLDIWMTQKTKPEEAFHRAIVAESAKIKQYYNMTSDVYTISTVLDPRFKLDYYKKSTRNGQESYQETYDIVNVVYTTFYAPAAAVTIEEDKTIDDDFYIFDQDIPLNAVDEFREYCNDKNKLKGGKKADVLGWWKTNSKTYPNLSRMARDYLAIPGTSSSSERLFSTGKHLITDTRCSMSPTTIEACQCLKSWL